MAIPYFNCLVVSYSKNRIDSKETCLKTIYSYLEEYFSNNSNQAKQTDICINCKSSKVNEMVQEQMRGILVAVIKQMSDILIQINGRYSAKEETKLIFNALNSIEIKPGTSQKQPVQLQNLSLLKQYYKKFKSEGEMKDFLKNLLIQEISLSKKTIKYRKPQQVSILLKIMTSQISGEISIINCNKKTSQLQNVDDSLDKSMIWIVLMERTDLQVQNISSVICKLEKQYEIDRSINQKITQSITLNLVKQVAQNKVRQLAYALQSRSRINFTEQLKQFKASLLLFVTLKTLAEFGEKLVEQQRSLKAQFVKFVQEMRLKYSGILSHYIKGFSAQLSYKEKRIVYKKSIEKRKIIEQHIRILTTIRQYNIDKKNRSLQLCRLIQNRIRSFLIIKSAQNHILSAFVFRKNEEFRAQKAHYEQIRQLYNSQELQKLSATNKFKYGFSCVSYILQLNNFSCYEGFKAQNLLLFLQKANRPHQIFVKIKCFQTYIEATTIEGKVFSMGQNNSISYDCNAKQNNSIYNNSQCLYTKSTQNFSSKASEISLIDKLASRQSKVGSRWNSLRSSKKQPTIHNPVNTNDKSLNYDFKLDNTGKLFGRGDNTLGQLGLGELKYANNYTCLLPLHRVKLYSTLNQHTIIITTQNKVFYCGKQKAKLPATKIPLQITLKDKISIKQVICAIADTLFLTDRHKIYSLNDMNYVPIPKPIQLQFDHFHLVRTGSHNLQIVYLLGYWSNTLDKVQHQQITKYLTSNHEQHLIDGDSLLVDDLPEYQDNKNRNNITELSAILQSPLE